MIHKSFTTRRAVLKGTAAAGGALAAPAVLRRAWAAEPIKVSSYGGYFEDMLSEFAYPAFTKATGIEVETVSQPGGFEWFVNLKSSIEAGTPAVDVTMAAQGSMRRMPEIFVPLAEDAIPNMANVPEYFILRDDAGAPLGCPVLAWYATFVTNTDVWPNPPVSLGRRLGPEIRRRTGLGAQRGFQLPDRHHRQDLLRRQRDHGLGRRPDDLHGEDGRTQGQRPPLVPRRGPVPSHAPVGRTDRRPVLPRRDPGHDRRRLPRALDLPQGGRPGGLRVVVHDPRRDQGGRLPAVHRLVRLAGGPDHDHRQPVDRAGPAARHAAGPVGRGVQSRFEHHRNPSSRKYAVYVEKGDWIAQKWSEFLLDV